MKSYVNEATDDHLVIETDEKESATNVKVLKITFKDLIKHARDMKKLPTRISSTKCHKTLLYVARDKAGVSIEK